MVNAEITGRVMDQVGDAIRRTAAELILPRWRKLAADEISEKTGPGDLVTVADREAEARLAEVLTALLPGSVVVGEEATAVDPTIAGLLRGDAPVWIVDPVDGTANFVAGKDEFATMVALAEGGEVLASWTYGPRLGVMGTAVRGGGAYVDGRPVRTASGGASGGRVLRVATSQFSFLTRAERRQADRLDADGILVRQCRCAGLDYLEVARGGLDAVAFTWEAPWDHAAGLLLVMEAGGASFTASGEPFRVVGGNALPFAVARDEVTAARVVARMTAVS